MADLESALESKHNAKQSWVKSSSRNVKPEYLFKERTGTAG